MRPASLSKIVTHDAPGEFRAAAIDRMGRACRLFDLRQFEEKRLRLGDYVEARVRSGLVNGGLFVETESGAVGYVSKAPMPPPTDGQLVVCQVKAEARYEKEARMAIVASGTAQSAPFKHWVASLPDGSQLPVEDCPELTEMAFEQAQLNSATLPNGGAIHIERTRALIAVDIDTAGRKSSGSVGAKALSINREAAIEAARVIALKDYGGAIVIDCVDPINKAAREQIRKVFVSAFETISNRRIRALTPSALGFLEAAIEWGASPFDDPRRFGEGDGSLQTQVLSALRKVERYAEQNGAALVELALPEELFAYYTSVRAECDGVLSDRFGGRVLVQLSEDNRLEIRNR